MPSTLQRLGGLRTASGGELTTKTLPPPAPTAETLGARIGVHMFVLAGPGKTPVRLVSGRSVELMVKPLLR